MSFPNRGCTIQMGSEIDELTMLDGSRNQPMFDPSTRECVGEGNWRVTQVKGMTHTPSHYACDIHIKGWRRYGASAVNMNFVIEEF